MFLQLAEHLQGQRTTDQLLDSNYQLIAALAEFYWNNRRDNFTHRVRRGWSHQIIDQTAQEFRLQLGPPPVAPIFENDLDHVVYAWSIENTRIYDIFAKVLKAYRSGEKLGQPRESRPFWETTERLFFSAALPTMAWCVTSSIRSDEVADRMSTYWSMLGVSLAHDAEIVRTHPYVKPGGANLEFIPAFETFAREVWRGIANRNNQNGPNDTDNTVITTEANRIRDMFRTRRAHGNLLREEFRAVATMSWLHLAVLFNSPAVRDLGAEGESPEQRLSNMGQLVGIAPHPKSSAFFALAQPFSLLITSLEDNLVEIIGPEDLYNANAYRGLVETVIGQYSRAMGRNLKAMPVTVSPQEPLPERLPSPQRPLQLVSANQQAGNSGQTAQPAQAN